jgi:hypothetical protein
MHNLMGEEFEEEKKPKSKDGKEKKPSPKVPSKAQKTGQTPGLTALMDLRKEKKSVLQSQKDFPDFATAEMTDAKLKYDAM